MAGSENDNGAGLPPAASKETTTTTTSNGFIPLVTVVGFHHAR